jgi:hypothetical protein
MELTGPLFRRLNNPLQAFATATEDAALDAAELNTKWNDSHLNPKNRVDHLPSPAALKWRMDGSARLGTRFFTIPTFLLSHLTPLRIDTYVPEQSEYPAWLGQSLGATDAFRVRDERVAYSGISIHILHALDVWSSRQPGFEAMYKSLPFGSRIVINNIHKDVKKMDIAVHADYEIERQMLSLKALQTMWNLPEEIVPKVIDLSELKLQKQLHESISLVQIPKLHGSELLAFKSLTDDLKYIYHELKVRLTLPPHANITDRPLYIITRQCLFGGKKGVCGFVMRHYSVGSLKSALPERRISMTLSLRDQLRWSLQITSALLHLNTRANRFFPDLRPENILIDDDNDLAVTDFEQRGGWHPWGPPEICYLKYLQSLSTSAVESASPLEVKYQTMLLEHASPELLRSTHLKRYENPDQGYALPWLLLDSAERESAQVYMLGLLLWCIFEGQAEAAPDVVADIPQAKGLEFPEFRQTPPSVRKCIEECTHGAPQWEQRWHLGYYREGTTIYAKPRKTEADYDEENGTARDVLETNREWWGEQVDRMERYMEFQRAKKHLLRDDAGVERIPVLVDPSSSTKRPSLKWVEQMLKQAQDQLLEGEQIR